MKHSLLVIVAMSLIWVGCSESNTPASPSVVPDTGNVISSSSSFIDVGVSSGIQASSSSVNVSIDETTLWTSGDGAQVFTGGYWFGYDDLNDGGTSTWACDGVVGKEGDEFEFCTTSGPIVVDFSINSDIELTTGGSYGFAGVGFNLLEVVDEIKQPYDLSSYKSITIEYESNANILMQLVYDEKALAYDVHRVKLLASAKSSVIKLSDFKQAGWGVKGDLAANLDKITEIKFQAHSDNVETDAKFTIKSIILN